MLTFELPNDTNAKEDVAEHGFLRGSSIYLPLPFVIFLPLTGYYYWSHGGVSLEMYLEW